MTTLIQNEQKRQKIMARMREHLVPVLEHCRGGWVGLFLQGSQNYNLDYEGSDIDTVPVSINQHANEVLQKATVEILKRSFLKEIQGGE